MSQAQSQDDDGMANQYADLKSWKEIENEERGSGLGSQKKNALFEMYSAVLERDGEISTGMIANSCKNSDDEDLTQEMLKAVKEHQPVYEKFSSGVRKLVVRDESR